MSYILDALRRADAERERGQVPGLHAQPGWNAAPAAATPGNAARSNSGGRQEAMAVGAILLVALLVWLSWRAFGPGSSTAALQAPSISAPTTAPPPGTASVPTTDATAPAVTTAPRPETPIAAAATATTATTATAATTATTTTAAIDKPAARPARKPVLPAATTAALANGRALEPASAARPAAPGNPASAAEKIYALEELPEDVRRDLPKLAIGGSIYSESRASRFVIVNGQLFHEGDSVAPGLVLQQIRLKSAVLGFRGYRYGISY